MAEDRFQLLPTTLGLLVLKLRHLHRYAIASAIQPRSKHVPRIEEGSLHPALHRMEKRGSITAEWGISESHRRAMHCSLEIRDIDDELAFHAGFRTRD